MKKVYDTFLMGTEILLCESMFHRVPIFYSPSPTFHVMRKNNLFSYTCLFKDMSLYQPMDYYCNLPLYKYKLLNKFHMTFKIPQNCVHQNCENTNTGQHCCGFLYANIKIHHHCLQLQQIVNRSEKNSRQTTRINKLKQPPLSYHLLIGFL